MSPFQILADLARIRRQLSLVLSHLKQPRRFNPNKPVTFERHTCPNAKCRHPEFEVARIYIPNFNLQDQETFAASRHAYVPLWNTAQILDAWCPKCGYDWQRILSRIEPVDHDPQLLGIPPVFRYSQWCPECLEQGVRGYFRNGYCTAGICVSCRNVFGPNGPCSLYNERRAQLRRVVSILWAERERLLEIARKTKGYDEIRYANAFLL